MLYQYVVVLFVCRFVADATRSDNYQQVSAAINDKLGDGYGVDTITLSSELNNGTTFSFTVLTTNFLGVSSPPFVLDVSRAPTAIPTVTIAGVPLIILRKDRCIVLPTAVLPTD